jgi:uncharacterized membrane protein YuzA (DUF378 family)
MSRSTPDAAGTDPGRVRLVTGLAMAIGVVYTLVGLAGFLVTGFDGFAEPTHDSLLGFHVNPLHNIVHLLIGITGIALARRLSGARTYGWLLAVGYGLVFIYGLVVDMDSSANFLSLNWADNWLHLLSALAGLLIALLPVGRTTGATTRS